MLVILPSIAILALYAAYTRIYRHPAWWMNIVLTVALFGLHMLELQLLSPGNLFRFLDEDFFARESQGLLSTLMAEGLTRYNAYLVYANLAQVMSPEWILKAVNVPWLWILLIQLYRLSGSSVWVLRLFPFALPYLYVLSFLNMRDMLSLVVLMVLIGTLTGRVRHLDHVPLRIIAVGAAVVLLASLRSHWVVFMVASFLMAPVIVGTTRMRMVAAFAMVAAVAAFGPLLSVRSAQLRAVAEYSVEARGSERVELVMGSGGFGVGSAVIGVGRQLFTPLPTSKMKALVTEPPGPNLYIKEVSRMIMNTWFMASVVLVMFRLRQFLRYVIEDRSVRLLALFAAINTLVYGLYFFGVGSSRNKILPMIVVFLFVCHLLDRRAAVQTTPAAN